MGSPGCLLGVAENYQPASPAPVSSEARVLEDGAFILGKHHVSLYVRDEVLPDVFIRTPMDSRHTDHIASFHRLSTFRTIGVHSPPLNLLTRHSVTERRYHQQLSCLYVYDVMYAIVRL